MRTMRSRWHRRERRMISRAVLGPEDQAVQEAHNAVHPGKRCGSCPETTAHQASIYESAARMLWASHRRRRRIDWQEWFWCACVGFLLAWALTH
jgi:hypothetical protein